LAYSDEIYIKLGRLSYEKWADLERRSGEKLIVRTGGVDFGHPKCVAELEEAFTKSGVGYETLTHETAKSRFPHFNFKPEHKIVYQPDGGVVLAEKALNVLWSLAEKNGAKILTGEKATGIKVEKKKVTITTLNGNQFKGKKVVLAMGAWTKTILEQNGLGNIQPQQPASLSSSSSAAPTTSAFQALKVTQEQVVYYAPKTPAVDHTHHQMPVWIYHIPEGEFYGIPHVEGSPGIKVGSHRQGPTLLNPDLRVSETSRDMIDRRQGISDFVSQIFPHVSVKENDNNPSVSCLYTNTPDNDFIIDRHPLHPSSIVIATPCSGHGFKFGSAYGLLIASLVSSKHTSPIPLQQFSIQRRVALPPGWASIEGDFVAFLRSNPNSQTW
jgi:glycine/D-amino acid oxidase-like deaminating enzyme